MKIIAIGDIHGRDRWKEIVDDSLLAGENVDKFVFLGDYFDTRESISAGKQMKNFKDILLFKRFNKDKAVMLLGNHDFHYLSDMSEKYSGYQDKYATEIEELVRDGLSDGSIQLAFSADGWLFTHAGVTKTWASACDILSKDDIAGAINGLFVRTPQLFKFTFGESRDVYGGDPANGPIWVRPEALVKDKIDGYKQVVGHTTQQEITIVDGEIAFIDCLGTSGEVLRLIDGKHEK